MKTTAWMIQSIDNFRNAFGLSNGNLMNRPRMSKSEVWSEEAGILPEKPDREILISQKILELRERARLALSTVLHQIRCKWCISAVFFITAGLILLSTVPLFPLLRFRSRIVEEGPIGPQLDPKMRPCRKILNFSPTPLPKIALASFTGSGNTYLRGAIEQITGIWTGSAVPDYQLYHGGFYGEVTADSKVLLVKTHGYGKKASKMGYKKVILLVRKPEEAILAKWNQQKTRTHTGIAKGDTYDTEEWNYFSKRAVTEWKDLNEYWLAQNPSTLHVVQFEDLIANKKEEIKKILDFIGFTDVDEDIFNCVVDNYEGLFRRKKYKLDFEPFSQDVKEQLENARDLVQQAVEEWKFSKFDSMELDAELEDTVNG